MLYTYDVTIPAGTTKADPVVVEAPLASGIITQVQLVIPDGVAGLAFTRARRSEHQLWPTNPDGALTGDGDLLLWDEDYELDDPPLFLYLTGWAPNARFPHTLTWRFGITSRELLLARDEDRGVLRRIWSVLGGGS